jgi:hypothetical protein
MADTMFVGSVAGSEGLTGALQAVSVTFGSASDDQTLYTAPFAGTATVKAAYVVTHAADLAAQYTVNIATAPAQGGYATGTTDSTGGIVAGNVQSLTVNTDGRSVPAGRSLSVARSSASGAGVTTVVVVCEIA